MQTRYKSIVADLGERARSRSALANDLRCHQFAAMAALLRSIIPARCLALVVRPGSFVTSPHTASPFSLSISQLTWPTSRRTRAMSARLKSTSTKYSATSSSNGVSRMSLAGTGLARNACKQSSNGKSAHRAIELANVAVFQKGNRLRHRTRHRQRAGTRSRRIPRHSRSKRIPFHCSFDSLALPSDHWISAADAVQQCEEHHRHGLFDEDVRASDE